MAEDEDESAGKNCCLTYIISYTIFVFICILCIGYYKSVTIPDNIINIIRQNLESTPIMEILFDNQCDNDNTSNLLGYYYGFDSGFIFNDKSYSKENKEKTCKGEKDKCINFNSQPEIPYNIFKGKKLCTSKRPKKNYFDYVKYSVGQYYDCPIGMKACGKLDIKRNLCINNSESCPINDIIYNNQPEYIDDYYGITYYSIKINDNEYLHYTNEKIDNYIITNLTVLGRAKYGFPCGANDNNKISSYSSIEKNIFCIGEEKKFEYYYYDALTTISLKEFYEDNKIDIFYLPEYKELTELEDMTLYSTGYFSLSEKDIKNFKGSPNPFKKHNKYSKIISICSLICYIMNFIFGIYGTFIIPYGFSFKSKLCKFIILISFCAITFFIIIFGLIEMIFLGFVFDLTGEFPKYFYEVFENIYNSNYKWHFWIFLIVFISQIISLIILGFKYKRKKESNKNTELAIETNNETKDILNSDFITSTPIEIPS